VRIQAAVRTRSAVWHHVQPGYLAVGVWTEKKDGLGEDAEPLLLHNRARHNGIAAVFDGAGGAGAASAGQSLVGEERSHAWVASRTVRGLVEESFLATHQSGGHLEADRLREHLTERLGTLRAKGRRKIQGSMRRELPTTLAAVAYQVQPDRVSWRVLWAGDSRAFLLTPRNGLQQLSLDDTDSQDALELLVDDPIMTNMVCADRPFTINSVLGEAGMPCVILCATDGFFGYVNTPAEFEHVLLDTLMSSVTCEQWSDMLATTVSAYSGDDASLALAAFGFENFDRFRGAFAGRAESVVAEHLPAIRQSAENDRSTVVAARTDSWARYRSGYEQRMPQRQGENKS
jgi:serine/threonine protein phosphatase PrpC